MNGVKFNKGMNLSFFFFLLNFNFFYLLVWYVRFSKIKSFISMSVYQCALFCHKTTNSASIKDRKNNKKEGKKLKIPNLFSLPPVWDKLLSCSNLLIWYRQLIALAVAKLIFKESARNSVILSRHFSSEHSIFHMMNLIFVGNSMVFENVSINGFLIEEINYPLVIYNCDLWILFKFLLFVKHF